MDSEPTPIDLTKFRGMVHYVCHKFQVPHPIEDSEEYAEGWLGLMKAARLFDHSKGTKFSTFAYFGIQKAILSFRSLSTAAKRGGAGCNKDEPIIDTVLFDELSYVNKRSCVGKEVENKEQCEYLLSKLHPRDRAAVEQVVMGGYSRREAAVRLGASHVRVGEWVSRGLYNLRKFVREDTYNADNDAI